MSTDSLTSISPPRNISLNLSVRRSIPFSSLTETYIIFSLSVYLQSVSGSILLSISVLLTIIMAFLPFMKSSISMSSSVRLSEASSIMNIISAFSAHFLDFSTPILSTVSPVSLMPAVSTIFTGMPPRFIYSSTVSLVVPGMSVTMALSSISRRLSSELLPTLGFPSITASTPSLMTLPISALSRSFFISFLRAVVLLCISE